MTASTLPNPFNFKDVTAHFSPAWFASVMGTAVIPLALSFIDAPFIPTVATMFMVLALVMFLAALLPWTLKFIWFPQNAKKDFKHPIAANFFPTMPISLIIFALDLLKYPTLFFSAQTSRTIALWLWVVGVIGIYAMGFPILLQTFRHQGIDLMHANFGWYIPPVSKLIIPAAGFELAIFFPQHLELTFGLSMVSFGIGFFLFLFVGAAVYHRYIYHELPMSRFAATFFIGLAPTAIIAVILFKLTHLLEQSDLLTTQLGLDPHVFTSLAKLGILFNWGLAAWWFLMALLVIFYYWRRLDLPYALSWWAFTFPSGALAVSTGVSWKVTQFGSIHGFYWVTVAFLLVVWAVVALRTVKGMISRQVFAPSH